MNAKSKFSIPILSGTRPEVGLFSATVAAPSLRNASNLVAGVPVSSHPMITTGVTSNNSIAPYFTEDGFNYLGDEGYRVCYPGTNAELAQNGSSTLHYLNSSKKTIQLDVEQMVTGPFVSDMMVNYLKSGKMEGNIESRFDVSGVFATATNSLNLDPDDNQLNLPAELYDCSPFFNYVYDVEVTAATQGANYITTPSDITARMVYFVDKDGVIGTKATGFVLGSITSNGAVTNPIETGLTTLLDSSIGNIPVDGVLTVEDGQVINQTLIPGGPNYPANTSFLADVKVVTQGPNPSSVSGLPGQGLVLFVSTDATGQITVNGISDHGSGYSNGDIVELPGPNGQGSGALVRIDLVGKQPSTSGTLATPKVTSQYRPGSGAPIGPFDSYTVESIKLPNGTIKHLALNSEENICQSKVPKARVFTAGGHKAYYPQISSGLQPTNWNSAVGAALCANPVLCLPVGISSQNGQTIVNGVPV